MENQLPEIIEFAGSGVTEGDFKVSLNKLLLYLDELLGSNGQKLNLIPSGIISMWSGAISAMPKGWALCNGENGTPDLRDRFIVGAGNSYEVGETGGAVSESLAGETGATTLTIAQMPSHKHAISSAGSDDLPSTNAGLGTVRSTSSIYTSEQGGGGSHSHSISGSVSTLPPYFALCFIMKI